MQDIARRFRNGRLLFLWRKPDDLMDLLAFGEGRLSDLAAAETGNISPYSLRLVKAAPSSFTQPLSLAGIDSLTALRLGQLFRIRTL
jgi:hypothetical protein